MSIVWSYTGLSQFKTCPYQFYRQVVARDIPKADTEALRTGREIHKMLEDRISLGAPLPPAAARFEPHAQRVIDMPGTTRVELKLGIDAGWNPASFFGDGVVGRGAIDVLNIRDDGSAKIIDWKTGQKARPSACLEQFKLNAGLVFANFPQVQTVSGLWAHIMIGVHVTQGMRVSRERDYESIKDSVAQQVDAIGLCETSGMWPCRPSGLCKGWCPVTDCRYWRPNPKVKHG
jgi:hypothetical protein